MAKIWLHRISYHAEVAYPLLERGYLSIGFSDFCKPEVVDNILEEDWSAFENCFDEEWGERPRNRYNLWHFREMRKGDWVIVPSSGNFSIYEFTEEWARPISSIELTEIKDWYGNPINKKNDGMLYSNENLIDLGFIRAVKVIKSNIPRNEYADSALISRMKIRQTNADISNLEDSIRKAIIAFEKKEPINIYSQIVEISAKQILAKIISELNPNKFELLVKWYFERIGASEVYIPAKNESGKEGDADVVATFEPLKTIIFSQVKFHTGETSDWAVEQIKNYKDQKESMDDGYSKISWVISSAESFSPKAYDLAKEAKIQLINGIEFTTMLLEAGITNLGKAL